MPRVKVGLPDKFLYSMERSVGISDLNYAKHLDSVAMVNILQEARLQFSESWFHRIQYLWSWYCGYRYGGGLPFRIICQ